MSDAFTQLLTATVQHLEELKAHGTRFVTVDPAALAALRHAPLRASSRSTAMAAQTPQRAPVAPVPVQASAPPAPPSKIAVATLVVPPTPERPGASAPSSAPSLADAGAQAQAIAELRERALVCVKCPHLAAARTQVVFGVGDLHAPLMFVGEAPGADEDAQGEPFVGAAGQLLTKIIQTMGFSRDTVYIANILKCRPDTPGQRSGNRKPTAEEMQTCLPYLQAQIDLIQPRVLVALGGTAAEGLLGKQVFITRVRGQWHTYRDIPLMLTYHPSYLLRNQARSERRKLWEDLLLVMERLGLPISERQRGYFL